MRLEGVQRERVLRFLEELRSGNKEQGQGHLKKNHGAGKVTFCCEGVACELAVEDLSLEITHKDVWHLGGLDFASRTAFSGNTGSMPVEVAKYYGFKRSESIGAYIVVPYEEFRETHVYNGQMTFIMMNDDFGLTFPQIADMIEWYYIS